MKAGYRWLLLSVLSPVLLLGGCAGEVAIRRVDPGDRVHYGESLTVDGLRRESVNVLGNYLLQELARENPAEAVRALKQINLREPRAGLLAVQAELCLNAGLHEEDPDQAARFFLTAVVYSYAYLQAADRPERNPYNPDRITMMQIYNTALTEFLADLRRRGLADHSDYQFTLIGGETVRFRSPEFYCELPREQLGAFELCANYRPENLTHQSFRFGLGAPVLFPVMTDPAATGSYKFYDDLVLPATAVLTFARRQPGEQALPATLKFFHTREYEELEQEDGRKIPLALDFSTPLAYMSQRPLPLGFLSYMLKPAEADPMEGLYLLEPCREDRIPVVLVHGLMSNTRTWLQLLNTLQSDPVLRRYYQFWGFTYSSGNPVLYSAKLLRDALDAVRAELVASGRSTRQFDRMVVVGHSMGGLLSKTLVLDSDGGFAEGILNQPLEQVLGELRPEQQEFVREMLLFRHRDYVRRVVFLAVPHRGSLLARSWLARLGSALIRLPEKMVSDVSSVVHNLALHGQLRSSEPDQVRLRTGIDNLDPADQVLQKLSELPFPEEVPRHSIIGNRREAGIPGGSDGVVEYTSSHLDGVESELVVRSGHSVQRHPLAIQELRRILLLHLKQYPELRLPAPELQLDAPAAESPDSTESEENK